MPAVSKMEMLSCLSMVNLSFIGKTESWGHNCDSLQEQDTDKLDKIKWASKGEREDRFS